MAHIGMKYPVAANLKEDGSYDAGFVVGRAINFTGTPNKNDVKLYADDGVAETDTSIRDIGVSLNVDDVEMKNQATLLGHTYTAASEEGNVPETMVVGSDDVAPYFGTGFYKRRKKNGVVSFTAIWLPKVQYSEPTENAETKGETTNFQTDTIEGIAYPVEQTVGDEIKTVMREKVVFAKEADAIAWLNKKANITKVV